MPFSENNEKSYKDFMGKGSYSYNQLFGRNMDHPFVRVSKDTWEIDL